MSYLEKIATALQSLDLLHSDVEKISGQIESAASEYKTQSAQHKPQPTIQAELRRPQAEVNEESARTARTEGRDSKRLLIETLAVVVGGVVAVVNIALWIQTREATRIAAISADAAQRGAKTAADGVEINKKLIQENIDSFRLDQRAWVGPKEIVMQEMKAPHSIWAKITIANTGKTPALNVKTFYFLHATTTPLNIAEYVKHPVEKAQGPLSAFVMLPNITKDLAPRTGSTDELGIQGVANGKQLIYAFAWITYDDVFGRPHKTRLCALYDYMLKGFTTCIGNYDAAD